MKKNKIIYTTLLTLASLSVSAQGYRVEGRVLNSDNQPIEKALVTFTGSDTTLVTDNTGSFVCNVKKRDAIIKVNAEGYYILNQPLMDRAKVQVVLVSKERSKYNEDQILPMGGKSEAQASSSVNISSKDFGEENTLEGAMRGEFAGLQIIGKSGMPGEGSYMNLRGIRSLTASNQPLIVINGVPYMPDTESSPIIGGYSRGIFNNYDLKDIANITVLKGAGTAIYGSLGSNGVILIETNGANDDDMETKISFSGRYGMNWNKKILDVMNRDQYRSYLNDIALTNYTDMANLENAFPYLKDNNQYYYNYLYNNNTDWQDEIYSPSFTTDNVLRIEGGDAIAKYDISLGYMGDGGVYDNTDMDRYHTQINTNITVSRKFEIFTTVGLAYMKTNLQEQGMVDGTNPLLEATSFAPVFSPYIKEHDESLRSTYNTYRYNVSNPVAIVNSLVAQGKTYDVNIRAGLRYKPTANYTFSGVVGLMYNYNQENVFIPGLTSSAIIPLNSGLAKNTSRDGVGESINMYYNVNAAYSKVYDDIHDFNAQVGFQAITSRKEYDAGTGYNTANDFYQTLGYVTDGSQKYFGYINLWNWMNMYGHADYTYNNLLKANVNISFDGASSVGKDATRFTAYPSAGVTFMVKNLRALSNSTILSRLDLRAEYGLTGNSRFSSVYGKNYYRAVQFMELSGILRSTVPNTNLKAELNKQLNLGVDFSFLRNRIDLSVDYYNVKATDLVFTQPVSTVVYGTADSYNNSAEIENNGVEISLRADLVRSKDFDWTIGGNIAFHDSQVKSLGKVQQSINSLADDAEYVVRIGENPYNFYGYETAGVFMTKAEAKAANLSMVSGEMFEAGDVHFVDRNGDGVINNSDKTLIGKAMPDFFGGFYTSFRYKNWTLGAEFTYSFGNDAYNAVRRHTESMSSWDNQSLAATNRWRFDGHITDMPRAVYGDPKENSRFSDRWIEDASYVKLKNVTLGYTLDRKIFGGFVQSAYFYMTAENIYTWTKYLGMDPEFAYSYADNMLGCDYAKAILPKSVKVGFNLKF